MERDYKHRAATPKPGGSNRKPRKRKSAAKKAVTAQQPKIAVWRWGLVFGVITLFVYFLYSLSVTEQQDKPKTAITKPLKSPIKQATVKKVLVKAKSAKALKPKDDIQYDFYTILPEAEFVIPDYEVKTRKREERVGKAKTGVKYSVQAGAFRHYKDADSLKARLFMMGFSPKIEKAVIGSTTWYRVKMGPYNRLASVDAIQSKLKSKNMDTLVIEVKN
ncbi:MAG: SPOR domain-containing protein [Methyloprofundus sp.]|nr:SPOR domain-containing protein [Methyloprofundus sp.]